MRSLALLLLCLAGCGGGGPRTQADCPINVMVHLNLVALLPDGRLGECDRCQGDATYIRVRNDLPDAMTVRVIAHELGHAAGLAHDYDSLACLMDQLPLDAIQAPCLPELTDIAATSGPLDIFPGPGAYDDTLRAAQLWNDALGRALFLVH